MANWNTGEFADPILPAGNFVGEVSSITIDETPNGTPKGNLMVRISEFNGEYDMGDPAILDPDGQTVFGTFWLPKEGEDHKKSLGKERKVRKFLEVMQYAGVDLEFEDDDAPSDVLMKNLSEFIGKSFKGRIQHTEATEEYPSKAEIDTRVFKRA